MPPTLSAPALRRKRPPIGLFFLTVFLSGCAIATPFRDNPGTHAKAGSAIAAITEAQLGADRAARSRFWDGTRRVEQALMQQPGFLGYSIRREILGNRAWTMTVWQSEADLLRFVQSEVHREAIRIGRAALVSGRFARVPLAPGEKSLSWAKALEAIESGRNLYE